MIVPRFATKRQPANTRPGCGPANYWVGKWDESQSILQYFVNTQTPIMELSIPLVNELAWGWVA